MTARHLSERQTAYADIQERATFEHTQHARLGLHYPECQTCRRAVRGDSPKHRRDVVTE